MKLSKNIEEKLGAVIEAWAEEFLPGRPAILGAAVYSTLEQVLIKQTEQVIETFPTEGDSK